MIVEELTPKPQEKVRFNLANNKYVPNLSGCYILSTYDNNILYIGLASSLKTRFNNHILNPDKTNITEEGKAIWFYFELYDVNNLPKLERTWIKQFIDKHGKLPLLNKVNSPVS